MALEAMQEEMLRPASLAQLPYRAARGKKVAISVYGWPRMSRSGCGNG
jgi:hypothetical protein